MTTDTTTKDTAAGAPAPGSVVLDARGVTMRFGGLTAVRDVDLTVRSGEIVGLIGPNGAGKTTFFNCLTGLYIPTEGEVRYKDKVLPPKSFKVTAAGIARTFQNIRLFANMTVLENVLVGRPPAPRRASGRPSCAGPASTRPRPPRAPAPWSCWSSWASPRRRSSSPATSPTESSASWRSPARSPASPGCCSSTSPPRA